MDYQQNEGKQQRSVRKQKHDDRCVAVYGFWCMICGYIYNMGMYSPYMCVPSTTMCEYTHTHTQAMQEAVVPDQPFQLLNRMPWQDKEVAPAKLTPEQQEYLDSLKKDKVWA